MLNSRRESGIDMPSDPSELMPLVYDELRRIAASYVRGERPGQTLQATALVHEAYLRLVDAEAVRHWESRGHFFFAAAEAMRRILIEHARAKGRKKRGGGPGGAQRISLDAAEWVTEDNVDQILTLDEAICRMERTSPDQARVVRLRFYAGLSVEETAKVMDVSEATVMRLWRYARAWLWRELQADVEQTQ
jgi:RNA polymerase sigma factor (TIGR02999 family)